MRCILSGSKRSKVIFAATPNFLSGVASVIDIGGQLEELTLARSAAQAQYLSHLADSYNIWSDFNAAQAHLGTDCISDKTQKRQS